MKTRKKSSSRRKRAALSLLQAILWIVLCTAFSACDQIDWEQAKQEGTLQAYRTYLEEHPGGKYSNTARSMIWRLEYRDALGQNTITAYREYLRNYPESPHARRARQKLELLVRNRVEGLSVEQMQGATIEVETSMGSFSMKLFAEDAPGHARNIIFLAVADFYHKTEVSLVDPGRLVQMGAPGGRILGGPGYFIPAEMNGNKHVRGSVSMHHYADEPDTGGSQFFVCLKELPELDGRFTVFGRVVEGMDTIERMSEVETEMVRGIGLHKPREPIYIEEVRVKGLDIGLGDEPEPDQ